MLSEAKDQLSMQSREFNTKQNTKNQNHKRFIFTYAGEKAKVKERKEERKGTLLETQLENPMPNPAGLYVNRSKNKLTHQKQRKNIGHSEVAVSLLDSLHCGEAPALPGCVGGNNSNKIKSLLTFSASLNSLFLG